MALGKKLMCAFAGAVLGLVAGGQIVGNAIISEDDMDNIEALDKKIKAGEKAGIPLEQIIMDSQGNFTDESIEAVSPLLWAGGASLFLAGVGGVAGWRVGRHVGQKNDPGAPKPS